VLGRAVIGVGRTGHQDHRQVLGVRAGERIEGGESADANVTIAAVAPLARA
jgi:hypothetical protein